MLSTVLARFSSHDISIYKKFSSDDGLRSKLVENNIKDKHYKSNIPIHLITFAHLCLSLYIYIYIYFIKRKHKPVTYSCPDGITSLLNSFSCPDRITPNSGLTGSNNTYIYIIYIYI